MSLRSGGKDLRPSGEYPRSYARSIATEHLKVSVLQLALRFPHSKDLYVREIYEPIHFPYVSPHSDPRHINSPFVALVLGLWGCWAVGAVGGAGCRAVVLWACGACCGALGCCGPLELWGCGAVGLLGAVEARRGSEWGDTRKINWFINPPVSDGGTGPALSKGFLFVVAALPLPRITRTKASDQCASSALLDAGTGRESIGPGSTCAGGSGRKRTILR